MAFDIQLKEAHLIIGSRNVYGVFDYELRVDRQRVKPAG